MTDPTAIPIEVDARAQRMSGIAVRAMPFDVSYITQITDDLWMGGCADGLVLPEDMDHIVSLYLSEAYTPRRAPKSHLAVQIYDDTEGPNANLVVGIAQYVNACRRDGPTLVHCQAGLNRSGLVIGVALVLEGRTPDDAIALLRAKRSPAVLCNPVFEAWLRAFPWELAA